MSYPFRVVTREGEPRKIKLGPARKPLPAKRDGARQSRYRPILDAIHGTEADQEVEVDVPYGQSRMIFHSTIKVLHSRHYPGERIAASNRPPHSVVFWRVTEVA